MTTHPRPSHGFKSPTCGGFRGPTPPQPHHFPFTMIIKIPHHCADFSLPCPAPSEEEEEELKWKNKPTFHHVSLDPHAPTPPRPHL